MNLQMIYVHAYGPSRDPLPGPACHAEHSCRYRRLPAEVVPDVPGMVVVGLPGRTRRFRYHAARQQNLQLDPAMYSDDCCFFPGVLALSAPKPDDLDGLLARGVDERLRQLGRRPTATSCSMHQLSIQSLSASRVAAYLFLHQLKLLGFQ